MCFKEWALIPLQCHAVGTWDCAFLPCTVKDLSSDFSVVGELHDVSANACANTHHQPHMCLQRQLCRIGVILIPVH